MVKLINLSTKKTPIGSSTIKRNNAVVNGTRGNRIAQLKSTKSNVTTIKNKTTD